MKLLIGRLTIPVLLAAVILLSGCQRSYSDVQSALISKSGVKAESLLPGDVMMVIKMGTDDQKQHEYLDKMIDYFPTDIFAQMNKEIGTGFDKDFKDFGMSYERDLLPAIGDNLQVIFSMGGDIVKDEEPTIVMVIVPEDAEKLREIMKKSVDKGRGDEQMYGEVPIYSNPDNDSFFAIYKDVWVMSPDIEALKKSLDSQGGADSLLANENYQKGVEKMKGKMGFMFIDPSFVLEQLKDDSEAMDELGDMDKILEMANLIHGEFFGINVEEDGLRIKGLVYADVKKFKELGYGDMDQAVMPAYMYKDLPGENTLVYIESGGLKMSMEMLMEVYKDMRGFGDIVSALKILLASQRLDLEDDVLSFMDKGYAFNLQTSPGLLPYTGFYVDAGSGPESAKKVMKKIHDGLEELMENGDLKDDMKTAVSHDAVDCGGGECYSMKLDFARLPQEAKKDMAEEFTKEVVDFQYGVDGNNLAYLTLYPDFTAGGYDTLADNESFKEAKKYISGYDYQVTYMNFTYLFDYLDRWVRFGMEMEKNPEKRGMEDYEMVRMYLKPFKFMVLAAKKGSDSEMEMEGFIKISK